MYSCSLPGKLFLPPAKLTPTHPSGLTLSITFSGSLTLTYLIGYVSLINTLIAPCTLSLQHLLQYISSFFMSVFPTTSCHEESN